MLTNLESCFVGQGLGPGGDTCVVLLAASAAVLHTAPRTANCSRLNMYSMRQLSHTAPSCPCAAAAWCAPSPQGGRPASNSEPTALQRALERFGAQASAPAQRSKPAGSEHVVAADRFERLLAEAEACVRARSVSPCMLKGMPGPGASPTTGNMPAPRPITPLQLGVNAVDSPHGIASFMLPAAAAGPRRPASATASDGFGRGRHASLAQAVAAAAAAEANSAGDEAADAGLQGSPNSQGGVSVSNADILASRGDAARAFAAAGVDVRHSAEGTVGSNLPQDHHSLAAGDMPGHVQVGWAGCARMQPSHTTLVL